MIEDKVFYLLLVATLVSAGELPSYIKACSRSDVNLNECALAAGRNALPELVKGDKKMQVPVLTPLHLDEVVLNVGDSLAMTYNNVTVMGLENLELADMKIDPEAKTWYFQVTVPMVNMIVIYTIKGKIMILPIEGHGPGNITMVNADFKYNLEYDLLAKNGVEHIHIIKDNLEQSCDRMYFQLDNLFNGNERLGTEMNRFLNENWKEIVNEVGVVLKDTMKTITSSIIEAYFRKVPFDHILLP